MEQELTIGELSARTGVATSALRYYEREGLIRAGRTDGGQRRYARETIRRVSFVRVAQQVGLSLEEIHAALASLPESRTPSQRDWERLSAAWRPRIDAQIGVLERLRDRLDSCIGCGCLSLRSCHLLNPADAAARRGPGPRFLIEAADQDTGGGEEGASSAIRSKAATGLGPHRHPTTRHQTV